MPACEAPPPAATAPQGPAEVDADSAEIRKQTPQVLEQMRARLRELESQRKQYKVQIQKGFPEYFQLIQPRSPNHQEIAQQLQADELFISIIPTEDGAYAWAIDATGRVPFIMLH